MNLARKISVFLFKRSRIKYKQEASRQTGVIFGESFSQKNESMFTGLLIRSLLVLSVALGTIDGFMSSFNIGYNVTLVFLFLIVFNFFIMLCQFRFVLRVAAYAAVIWAILYFCQNNTDIVRSGVNALTNLMYELVRFKFKLPDVRGFEEVVADRSVTITALLTIFGCAYIVVLWEICGRPMNIIFTAGTSFLVISAGLFFGGVPSVFSVVLLTSAWLIVTGIKLSGKQHPILKKKDRCKVYQWGDVQIISKRMSGKAFAQLAVTVVVFVVAAASVANVFINEETYENTVSESGLKQKTDHVLKDAMIIAFSKYKNYTFIGRVSNGQLGQYASIEPDYEPDLEVTYLPSAIGREYLKTFVGTDYSSDGWSTAQTIYDRDKTNMTAKAAKESGQPFGKMRIKNLALYAETPFLPYYTDLDTLPDLIYLSDAFMQRSFPVNTEYEVIYYKEPKVTVDDSGYRDAVYQNYMAVPDENREPITKLCTEQGWSKDDPELNEKIAKYFQENFVYTLSPGLVPWKTDFVNYFLFENKEGVCAHFASAGTLIYRCLGIPARYVEGYALDYPPLSGEPTVLENEDAAAWASSGSLFADKPITVTLSDISAHGWVEIYKDGYGWVPVELTPLTDDIEAKTEQNDSISDQLLALLFSGEPSETEAAAAELKQKTLNAGIFVFTALLCLWLMLAAFILLKTLVRHIIRLGKFAKKDSTAVIEIYTYIMRIFEFRQKCGEMSHKDMAQALSGYTRSPELIVQTVEEILYSPDKPSEEECENAFIYLHTALEKLLKECSLSEKIKILASL